MNKSYNIFWYGLSFMIKSLIPLISLPWFAKYLNLEDFGTFALSIFFGTFISGLSNLGLLTVLERNYFEINRKHLRNYLFTIIFFVFCSLSLMILAVFFLKTSLSILIFRNNLITDFLIYGLLFSGVKSLNQYFYVYLKNEENGKIYSLISIFENVFNIILSLVFVINFQFGLKGFFSGQILGSLIVFIYFLFHFFNFSKCSLKLNLLSESLKLSLPLTPKIFFAVINTHFDRYMISLLSTMSGVGIFEIGQKLSNSIFIFMTTLQQIFSPKVYKKMFSKNKLEFNSIGKYLTPFFFLCILFAMPFSLFSKEILYLFFPQEFQQGSTVISILSILYVVYFFGKQPQLVYAKKTALISWLTFFSIFLNICLNIPFIFFYGFIGAAWATMIAGVISTLLNFYLGQKFTPIKYEKKLFIVLVYFIVVVLLNVLLESLIENNTLQIIFKTTSILILVLIGIFLKLFKKITYFK